MSLHKTDLVGEYLREADLRVAGLPPWQRRELIGDLQAHIEAARIDGARTESEMGEVLDRLGTPAEVAAAAYAEAGPLPPVAPPPIAPPPPARSGFPVAVAWVLGAMCLLGVMFVLVLGGLLLAGSSVEEAPAPEAVPVAPVAPPAPGE